MAFEIKPNTGSLFPNDRKTEDTHPDFRGEVLVDGKHYWISGWRKTAKSGIKFMSLAVQPKAGRPVSSSDF